MISFATTQQLRKIFKTERIFFPHTELWSLGWVRDAIYTHLHFLPQESLILTVGCPTQESVVFVTKVTSLIDARFCSIKCLFFFGHQQRQHRWWVISMHLGFWMLWGFWRLLFSAAQGSEPPFYSGPRTPVCVTEEDHSVRPFLEWKRNEIFTQSVSLQSHTPKLRKTVVFCDHILGYSCLFVHLFIHSMSILEAGLWGKWKEQRL